MVANPSDPPATGTDQSIIFRQQQGGVADLEPVVRGAVEDPGGGVGESAGGGQDPIQGVGGREAPPARGRWRGDSSHPGRLPSPSVVVTPALRTVIRSWKPPYAYIDSSSGFMPAARLDCCVEPAGLVGPAFESHREEAGRVLACDDAEAVGSASRQSAYDACALDS